MTQQVFDRMCQSGVVKASDLSQDPVMVDGYPRRHLYVTTDTMTGATPLIFWCVEMLETKGWTACHWHTERFSVRGVIVRRA